MNSSNNNHDGDNMNKKIYVFLGTSKDVDEFTTRNKDVINDNADFWSHVEIYKMNLDHARKSDGTTLFYFCVEKETYNTVLSKRVKNKL